MKCTPYNSKCENDWESFVANAWNATFLHTRSFLSYHGNRFDDASLLIHDDQDRLVALFPAAVHIQDPKCIVSHPGATFGGLVSGQNCRGETAISALRTIALYYRDLGFERLVYKTVPSIYHQIPVQDDLYAMFRLNGKRVRCDISAVVHHSARPPLTKGRKHEIAKAKKNEVVVKEDITLAGEIYHILEANLQQSHQTKPIHSLDELMLLQSKFPDDIRFMAALLGSETIAGLIMFNNAPVAHTQYIASSEAGRITGGLDFLIESAIEKFFSSGFSYFDFGISNEDEGRTLNDGLYRYKRTFGAGSVVHEFYELNLREL